MTLNQEGLTVEDRLDILDLFARQSHLIDGGNASAWAETFTEEGVFESPTYKLTARARPELEAFARSSNKAALTRGEQLRHHIDSVVMEARGPGAASAKAYLVILTTSAAGSKIDRSLRIEDELAKIAGRWLVSSRRVFRDTGRGGG